MRVDTALAERRDQQPDSATRVECRARPELGDDRVGNTTEELMPGLVTRAVFLPRGIGDVRFAVLRSELDGVLHLIQRPDTPPATSSLGVESPRHVHDWSTPE